MKQSELEAEIDALIEQAIAEHGIAPASWLVHTTVSNHPHIAGADVPFYRLAAFEHCRDTVRKVLRDYRPSADDAETPTPLFPGYQRIKRRYLIERNGEDLVVPTEALTPNELRFKAAEYRRMGVGCFEHADELNRLAGDRDNGDKGPSP